MFLFFTPENTNVSILTPSVPLILQYEATMNIKCKYSSYYTSKIDAKWNATVDNLTNQVADESDLETFCTQVHCIVSTAQHHQGTKLGVGGSERARMGGGSYLHKKSN